MRATQRSRLGAALLLGLAGLCTNTAAWAQGVERFPDRPLTWIVGFPAGGTADVVTRLVATRLERVLGKAIIVDNRPGAAGAIALQAAAKAAPDGYTLVTVVGPVLTSQRQPEIGRELMAMSMLARTPIVMVGTTGAGLPSTLKELVASAKAAPERFSFGSSGNGTGQHLAGELFNQVAEVKMVHIPYKGGNQAVTDVISGHIPVAFLGVAPIVAHVAAGKLRGYAISSATRSAALPQVPTFKEAGFPGIEASGWVVVGAPVGVPPERVQTLGAAISQVLKDPEVTAEFTKLGVEAESSTSQQATGFVAADLKRWRDLAQQARLPLD